MIHSTKAKVIQELWGVWYVDICQVQEAMSCIVWSASHCCPSLAKYGRMCVSVCVCMCVPVSEWVHASVCVCTWVSACICVCVCVSLCRWVHMCVCISVIMCIVYVCVCIHISGYACIVCIHCELQLQLARYPPSWAAYKSRPFFPTRHLRSKKLVSL